MSSLSSSSSSRNIFIVAKGRCLFSFSFGNGVVVAAAAVTVIVSKMTASRVWLLMNESINQSIYIAQRHRVSNAL